MAKAPAPATVAGDLHRVIASRYPAVSLFDQAHDAQSLEMLAELEGLTNDRLRDALGAIHLVPPGEGLYGPGTTPIMAAFCHPQPSRFTRGDYGVYYAGRSIETALAEAAHHRRRFLAAAQLPAETLEMRGYRTTLTQAMTPLPKARADLLDPNDYAPAQAFGAAQRATGRWGLLFPSVRHAGGECVAVFRPKALRPVKQAAHYRFHWDGQQIAQIERFELLDMAQLGAGPAR